MANAVAVPVLDQTTFEQMLEAAFILQQESRRSQKKLDPAATLVEIAAAQELLRSLADVSAAAKVIVERLERITSATAIAVVFLRNDHLEYCAATGTSASLAGSVIATPANIAELLQKDKARNSSANHSRHEHLQGATPNPILFPFYDKTSMVGFLHLNFPETELVAAHQMQSCQVMANLMGEAVVRVAESQWKQALAKEHAAVLEALERLKPQLERLTVDSSATQILAAQTSPESSLPPGLEAREPSPKELSSEGLPDISDLLAQLATPGATPPTVHPAGSVEHKDESSVVVASAPAVTESQPAPTAPCDGLASIGGAQLSSACGQCGYLFGEGESFCGRCGRPRSIEFSTREELLSFPRTHPESGGDSQPSTKFLLEGEVAPAVEQETPVVSDLVRAVPAVDTSAALAVEPAPPEAEAIATEPNSQMQVLLEHENSAWQSPWTSAEKARTWLESVKNAHPTGQWLGRHQGDISVAISVLVLLLAVLWWSPHQVAPKPRTKAPEPTLTLFERALVGLGLAQPPSLAPSLGGNPSVEVWEDVHTALYYCSGSEQYGKTMDGKVASQRDAQLDQFEPAARKPCE